MSERERERKEGGVGEDRTCVLYCFPFLTSKSCSMMCPWKGTSFERFRMHSPMKAALPLCSLPSQIVTSSCEELASRTCIIPGTPVSLSARHPTFLLHGVRRFSREEHPQAVREGVGARHVTSRVNSWLNSGSTVCALLSVSTFALSLDCMQQVSDVRGSRRTYKVKWGLAEVSCHK